MTGGFVLSDCLRLLVRDSAGSVLGRVADIEVEGTERFPRVTALHVRRGRETLRVPWPDIAQLGTHEVVVRGAPGAAGEIGNGRFLRLARDVLDAQVVDLAGKRLARVGDVELAQEGAMLRVVAVDVGLAPVARRLGLRRLARRMREEWIGWDGIYLASGRGHRVQLKYRAGDVRRLSHDELLALLAHLPAVRGAQVLEVARPGTEPDPLAAARRARRPRRRFRVMRARKRAPS